MVAVDETALAPCALRWSSVPISRVVENHYRLDASAYDMEAMRASSAVRDNPYGWVYLWGKDGLVKDAYYPGRYKRLYANGSGIPFFLPSQIEEVYPKPTKWLTVKTAKLLEKDKIVPNSLLMSRSGTVGKCTISSKTTIGKLFSDDVVRITFRGEYDSGYTYAFFKTEVGRKLVQSNNYGAVIDHIEPEHLRGIPIPNAPEEVKMRVHEAVVESYELRDRSNDLIDKAQAMLYGALGLPDEMSVQPKYYAPDAGVRCVSVRLSQLNNRLDASYHLPEVNEVLSQIARNAKEVTTLGDRRVSKAIILPERFKRVYVGEGKGVPFFGGKQILQLDPSGDKYLSLASYEQGMREGLALERNMCLVTRSGTIGKVAMVPTHWAGWIASEHVLRIIPAEASVAGFLYAWVSSPYCYPLIVRNSYGAVVDEIDDAQLAGVAIPLLRDEAVQQCINDLVLEANALRYQAYLKEHEAIGRVEELLNKNQM